MFAIEQQVLALAESNELAHYLAGFAMWKFLVLPRLDLAFLSTIQCKATSCTSLKFTACTLNGVWAGRHRTPQLKFGNTEERDSIVNGVLKEFSLL